MKNKDELIENLIGWFFALYFIVGQILAMVWFVQYCKTDNSILEIIFLDSFLSEIKGILWIFFIW